MRRFFGAWTAVLLVLASACGEQAEAPLAGRQLLNLGLLINEAHAKVPSGPARGVALAVQEYNSNSDSTYEVRVRREVANGPETAAQAAGRLAGAERLVGVVAALNPEETSAAAPAFEQASIPFLATSGDSGGVAGFRAFRRLIANSTGEGAVMAAYAGSRVDAPAVIFHDGITTGSAYVNAAKEVLERAKRPVHSSQKITGRTDLEGVLGSVPREGPSFILYGGNGSLGVSFAEALRRGGYKGPIIASHQIMEAKPTEAPDGLVSASVVATPADRELRPFTEKFHGKFRSAPEPLAVESYEGSFMLLDAIEEVEPRPREIAEFLQLSRSFLGDSKLYEYDDNGELKSPAIWIFASSDGKWRFSSRFDPTAPRRQREN